MRIDYSKQRPALRHPDRLIRGGVASIVLALLLSILPAPRAEASDLFTFEGGGWGHSVGMSQYGALGMSQEGFSWQQILSHYFTGASAATAPDHLRQPIWVNLMMENSSQTFNVRAIGPNPVPVTFYVSGQSVQVFPGQSATVTRLANGNCTISTPSGTLHGGCWVDAGWDGIAANPQTAIEIAGCYNMNWNAPGGPASFPCTYARGDLHLRADNNTNTFNTVLKISIDDYLLGIAEMPYSWSNIGGVAALQAQAVAARSYAYARARIRPDPALRPWCWCQLYDTTYDQNYVGWGHGTQSWIDAVRSTVHEVLVHPEVTVGGAQVPISTFYSSSTFGRTENSEDSFLNPVPYLKGVDDHWAGLPGVGNPRYAWAKSLTGSQLASMLPGMNTVTGAEITRCSASGAALEITFHGSGGPRVFHTRDLRGRLSLLSQQVVTLSGPSGTSSCTVSPPPTTTTTTVPPTTTTTTVPPTTTTTTVPPTTTTTTVPPTTTTTTVPPTTTTTTVPPTTTTTTVPPTTTTTTVPPTTTTTTVPPTTTTTTVPPTTTTTTVPPTTTTTTVPPTTTTTTVPPTTTTTTVPPTTTTTTVPPTTTTTTVPSGGETCPSLDFSIDALLSTPWALGLGSVGPEVADVQRILKALAIYDGPIDGQFGQGTTGAVRSFQDARGLSADGVVGSRTKGELASLHGAATSGNILASDGSLLKRGVSGATVRALQTALGLLGFNPGPADGQFGPRTSQAVLLFQQSNNLTADGIVGVQSRAALTQALGLSGYADCNG